MRERHYAEKLKTLSKDACGMGGILMSLRALLGGTMEEHKGGGSSLSILDLKWGMVLRSCCNIIGVTLIGLSKKLAQSSIVRYVLKML